MLVLDGRGEVASHLAGVYADGLLRPLYTQELPHSLGLLLGEPRQAAYGLRRDER